MRHIIQTLAFTLSGITISAFAAIATWDDGVLIISTAKGFLISSLISFALAIILVLWMTILQYCPKLAVKWPIRLMELRNYGKDVGLIISTLIPFSAASLMASANTRSPAISWLTDVYRTSFWILAILSIIFLLATWRYARHSRLERQFAENQDSSPSETIEPQKIRTRLIFIRKVVIKKVEIQVDS